MYKTLIIIILLAVAFVWSTRDGGVSSVKIGQLTIPVEVADTDAERMLGLSGRANLEEGTGLLFVFDRLGKYGFWMKDMNFAIDIAWIDEAGKIVHLESDVVPETYPKVFVPAGEALYVLEVNAGFLATHKINIGDMLEIKAN